MASVWTGYLTFGLISMPVRLFSGARGSRVSFHMLQRDDHVRVKQQLICPEEGKVVGRDEIVKGCEYRRASTWSSSPMRSRRMAALKQSLAQMDKKKGPHRAEEAQAASEVELKPKPQRAQRKKPKKAA